ncbi:hypothetical protein HPB51_023186 [Rhipicephalus microplus]|uniref:Tick transposon n=1 Tax=Rhipicephalus microplus TaxID=6941 RepID=A0A9J6EQ69_RHIMP|nr:hypothetical protein HPB51_023186 [Rhipicephalus microplus]
MESSRIWRTGAPHHMSLHPRMSHSVWPWSSHQCPRLEQPPFRWTSRRLCSVSAARTSSFRAPVDAAEAFDAELNDLLLFMRVELESREQRASPSPAMHDNTDKVNGDVPTASVMHNASVARLHCFFCRTDQCRIHSCKAVIFLKFNEHQLQKDHRCFHCTSKIHRAKYCRPKLTRSSCCGRHASSMSDPNYKRALTTTGTSEIATTCVSRNALLSFEETASTNQPPKHDAVYLQTFRTKLVKMNSRQGVRGILDGRSQVSFIKEEVARKINLKIVRQTRLALNTLGSTCSSHAQKRNVVNTDVITTFIIKARNEVFIGV